MVDNQSVARICSNDDLLTEILIRLPVTSIFRFKSISKHWRLLLTHRHFAHLYDNNNNFSKSLGLFAHNRLFYREDAHSNSLLHHAGDVYVPFDVENRSTPHFPSLDFYFHHSHVRIIQSCNGLLLCLTIHEVAINNYVFNYYVFNPTTKQVAIIPSVPGGQSVIKTKCSMALAFHQTDCVHYKVVFIRYLERNGDLIQVQVYSSDTRTWKICIESFYVPKPFFRHPVYRNGAIYCVSVYRDDILYFNLGDEEIQMLPLPADRMSYETSIMYFGESRGHLHLIFQNESQDYVLRVNVYEMLRDHSGWFVKYQLQLDLRDFPCLISPYECPGVFGKMEHPCQWDFKVVDVVRGKEEEDTFLVLLTPWKLMRYNVHDKSFKELYIKQYDFVRVSWFHRYIETLFSF